MNTLSISAVALIAAVVVGTPANREPAAWPVAAPASLVAPDACPYDDASSSLATASAMCKYLEKCCSGGTENAQKCCAAYLQRC